MAKSNPVKVVSGPDGVQLFLRLRATKANELRDAVRRGLPFSTMETLSDQLELSPQQCSEVLAIPARTVARRKENKQLNPQESDRLYRVARAASQAVEVLGQRAQLTNSGSAGVMARYRRQSLRPSISVFACIWG